MAMGAHIEGEALPELLRQPDNPWALAAVRAPSFIEKARANLIAQGFSEDDADALITREYGTG